jgi:ribosomal protein L21E
VVHGVVVAGRTVTIAIDGTGFAGQPRVTSHAGTTAVVLRDTGTVLIVRVKSAARSRNGTFTFTITLADGDTCQVRYIQR